MIHSVLKRSATSSPQEGIFSIVHFIFRDKIHDRYMITPVNLGVNDFGLSSEFCQQVLSPFILVSLCMFFQQIEELKGLLADANLPGRIVWTGSSTCSKQAFSWEDPQHIKGDLSFYSHKYLTHLLQPAINEHLHPTGVQSFEACPGIHVSTL